MVRKILSVLQSHVFFTLVFGGACMLFGFGIFFDLSGRGCLLIYLASGVFLVYWTLIALTRRLDPLFRAQRTVKREESVVRQVALYRERVLPLLRQKLPQTVYRFVALGEDEQKNELRFGTLARDELWFSCPKPLNDPFEGTNVYYSTKYRYDMLFANGEDVEYRREEFIDYLLANRKNFFLCSLSKGRESSSMWSRYAGESQGFCIEYEVTDTRRLYGVCYRKKKLDVGPVMERLHAELTFRRISRGEYEATLQEMQKLWFTYKSANWADEQEIRCIVTKENSCRAGMNLPARECGFKIKGIYLGMNCSEQHREKLQKIAAALGIFCKQTEPDYYGERAVIKVKE